MVSVELKISSKDWLYIILIGALFGFLISIFFYFLSVELKQAQTIYFSIFTAVSVSLFAFFLINLSNNYILPHVDKKFWYLISFVFSFCSGSLGFTFSYLLFSLFDGIRVIKLLDPYWIYISVTIGFLTFLIGLILHQFISMKHKNESIKSDVLESKIKALENELNPHFLFNALNSVSELIYVDQSKAEKAVLNISDFLRNAIYKDSLITLENEVNMLKTYVSIENIRFADKIKLNINIDTKHFYIMMPKFSIQLLVENAIKHGYLGKDLVIDINFNENDYSIEVTNNGKISNELKYGTGLNNLAKRLKFQNVGTLIYKTLNDRMMFIIKLHKDKF